jgi:hypothetical protein
MLLLTEKPFEYIRESGQLGSWDASILVNQPLPNQISFQEGVSGPAAEGVIGNNQGSEPAEGSIDAPRSRPERPRPGAGPNRYRAPDYRPRRPGAQAAVEQNYQTEFLEGTEVSDGGPSLLSSEVVLPPVDSNNPNFAAVVRSPNINNNRRRLPSVPRQPDQYPFDPYFPPNYPGAFPNQYPGYGPPPAAYPYQQPASSSSSTSTSGNGASASASSTGTALRKAHKTKNSTNFRISKFRSEEVP